MMSFHSVCLPSGAWLEVSVDSNESQVTLGKSHESVSEEDQSYWREFLLKTLSRQAVRSKQRLTYTFDSTTGPETYCFNLDGSYHPIVRLVAAAPPDSATPSLSSTHWPLLQEAG